MTQRNVLNVPGPGHYPMKSITGSETVGKTMGVKFKSALENPEALKVPGPGTYNALFYATKHSDPKWKIGTEMRIDQEMKMRQTQNFPPPNSYNPNYRTVTQNDPKWRFGSS